jgi:hypothetical protein
MDLNGIMLTAWATFIHFMVGSVHSEHSNETLVSDRDRKLLDQLIDC